MANHITCFGEVLFDVFPSGSRIGGAPLNVAFRLRSLGNAVDLISRIGDDALCSEVLKFLHSHNISSKNIQIDSVHKTGEVQVTLDANGNASYEIIVPCAWDFIEVNHHALQAVKNSDAFVFGSLVCRNEVSKSSLMQLLPQAKYKIFDVNLRAPFYNFELLKTLMVQADMIKFNDDELFLICENFGKKTSKLKEAIAFISEFTATPSICVTRGKHGAVLFLENSFYKHKGYKATVVNTVGAGDSFLATLIDQLLKKVTPKKALDFACKVGSEVVKYEEATPELSADLL
jgi:fructokinase